jgi:hypothetical protein
MACQTRFREGMGRDAESVREDRWLFFLFLLLEVMITLLHDTAIFEMKVKEGEHWKH